MMLMNISKGLAVGIILLFVGTAIIPTSGQQTKNDFLPMIRESTLYVGGSGPGNYTRIQDAVDNASDGDTVFVYDDSSPYVESVDINKAVRLLGENRNTTMIEGTTHPPGAPLGIHAHVTVCNFTIKGNGYGIYIFSMNNTIQGITFISTDSSGISIDCHGDDNTITNNFFVSGGYYYIAVVSDSNVISNNYFEAGDYTQCIDVAGGNYNIIKNNNFRDVMTGIILEYSSHNNIITGNTFSPSCYYDCHLYSSYNNTIYYNNFTSPTKVFDNRQNLWNEEYPSGGNYWGDYPNEDHYSGANQTKSGSDGIGDQPVNISGGNNQDHLPLIVPYQMTQLAFIFTSGLRLRGSITNGYTTALRVYARTRVDGGFVLGGREALLMLPKPLESGEQVKIKFPFIFGFGKVRLTVALWAENAPYIETTR
jgi:parallel beta-helix repeat protein